MINDVQGSIALRLKISSATEGIPGWLDGSLPQSLAVSGDGFRGSFWLASKFKTAVAISDLLVARSGNSDS